jgi:hypothetical protein
MLPDETLKTGEASDPARPAAASNDPAPLGSASSAPARATAPTSWQSRVAAAANPEEVIATCRERIAAIAPGELAALPRRCWPPAEMNTERIAEYALALVRCDRALNYGGPSLLRELAIFFTEASGRIAEMAAASSRKSRGLEGYRP